MLSFERDKRVAQEKQEMTWDRVEMLVYKKGGAGETVERELD